MSTRTMQTTSPCQEARQATPLGGTRLQAKLRIGPAGDEYEREADSIADTVMRMPEPGVQRKCSACENEERRVRRKIATQTAAHGVAPPIVHDTLNGCGRPLDPSLRSFMEPRFGHSFADVRVYTGAQAAESAGAIGALAYTVGNDVVFGEGSYRPESESGRRLIAHELTHVVQQNGSAPGHIQRRLQVENPTTPLPGAPARQHWEDIRDVIRTLSPAFDVDSAGNVTLTTPATCVAPVRAVDRCLCEMHALPDTWTIAIDDNEWPHTVEAAKRVVIQSSRSTITLGAWSSGGTRFFQDQARILGHELCGHGHLMEQGTHPPFSSNTRRGRLMGRPSHDATVDVENTIATELTGPGTPQRGRFADPHHGESFGRVTIPGFASGSSSVATLPATSVAQIDVVENFMRNTRELRADVIGHADHAGNAASNTTISNERAREVRDELNRRGIRSRRFNTVTGRSDAECPAAPVDNPDCRKVEVFMYIFEGSSERFP